MDWHNKTVIVTGGASGMGLEEARLFAQRGANVAVLDINGEGAAQTAREIQSGGIKTVGLKVDLTVHEEIVAAVKQVREKLGAVDVLVNNAGVFDRYLPSLETSLEQWNKFIALNLTSVFDMTNAVLPEMIERKKGNIVNIASVAGIVAGKGGAVYTATKHAVIGYTKHLTFEYARHGLRFNAVCPGTIETPLTKDLLAKIPKDPVPAKRFGTAIEVAELVVFLASDEAAFVNGAIVVADGGFTIQ